MCYEEHQWNTCADLTVVTVLIGLQEGYTNFVISYVNGTGERGTGVSMQSNGHSEEK
jgi:hypothetical protein